MESEKSQSSIISKLEKIELKNRIKYKARVDWYLENIRKNGEKISISEIKNLDKDDLYGEIYNRFQDIEKRQVKIKKELIDIRHKDDPSWCDMINCRNGGNVHGI
jgi:hypothetical protein